MDTTVECKLVDIDQHWDKLIQQSEFDIYHMAGWIQSSTFIDHGEAKALIITMNNKQLLFPLIIRKIDEVFWDITSTYGYSGLLSVGEISRLEQDYMLEQAIQYLKEKNCVSWFIRLHPILNNHWVSEIGCLVEHGPTLSSDLTKTEEEHWAETQTRHRRGIKKALNEGCTTKIERLNDENIKVFAEIYEETMRTLGASAFYFFTPEYYHSLSRLLNDNIILITAFDCNQIPMAASIYTHCEKSGIMQYHLGGTKDSYRGLQPAKLITHEARRWGKEHHYKVLHLGGGVGAQRDSLYEYKQGFSSNEHLFKTHRIVINQAVYDQLCNEKGFNQQEIQNLTEYFPLYRK
ncbi:GNAT family N-acetyltransferase [Pasteurella sp. PK-2025]|uniref:GNAT family N-acetyltransferase n=1 Tax=unclassified Pasteurella TaxID=2621516 RepID=UPI003C78D5E7